MIDIREHGGTLGGGGLNVKGLKTTLITVDNVQKGDFIGLYNDPNPTHAVPTFSNSKSGAFIPDTASMDYGRMKYLVSDAGHAICIRGAQDLNNNAMIFVKPYLNGDKWSVEVSNFIINGVYFSATKLNSNTFAIFHSLGGNGSPYGLAVSIVKIDDVTGVPSKLVTSGLLATTSQYLKNCHFVPMSDDNLKGVLLYTIGAQPIGYSDNVTATYGTLIINPNLVNVSMPIFNRSIIYKSGESYGGFRNINYVPAGDGVIFTTIFGDYKIMWSNGDPVMTTIRTTGANRSYDTITSLFRLDSRRIININDAGEMSIVSYDINNIDTMTSMGGGLTGSVYKMLSSVILASVLDRDFMMGRKKQNPQTRNVFKPVGSYAFVTIAAMGDFNRPGYALIPYMYYMSPDLTSLVKFTSGAQIVAYSQYIESPPWIHIDKDLKLKAFVVTYRYYEGQGSFRDKMYLTSDLALSLPLPKISKNVTVIHGVSATTGSAGSSIKCILSETVNPEFLIGTRG